jgi:hypothetical protein
VLQLARRRIDQAAKTGRRTKASTRRIVLRYYPSQRLKK